jgi:hypothetical protein
MYYIPYCSQLILFLGTSRSCFNFSHTASNKSHEWKASVAFYRKYHPDRPVQTAVMHYCQDRFNQIWLSFEQVTTSIQQRYYYTSLISMHRLLELRSQF